MRIWQQLGVVLHHGQGECRLALRSSAGGLWSRRRLLVEHYDWLGPLIGLDRIFVGEVSHLLEQLRLRLCLLGEPQEREPAISESVLVQILRNE